MVTTKQKEIIDQHVMMATGAAVPGTFIPASDLPVLLGIWAAMITRLGADYGYSFTEEHILKQLTAATAGVGFYFGGGKLFGSLLHLIPGVGTVTYLVMNATLNAIFTNRLGKLSSELFNQPGLDLNVLGKALEGIVSASFSSPPSPSEIKEGYEAARRSGKA